MRSVIIALAMALGLSSVSTNSAQSHFLFFQKHTHTVKKEPVQKKKVVKKKTVKTKKKKYISKKSKKELYQYRCNVYKKKGKLRKYRKWKRYCDRLNTVRRKSIEKVVQKKPEIPNGFFNPLFNNEDNSAASFFAADRALMNRGNVRVAVAKPSKIWKKKKPINRWFKKSPVAIARQYEGLHARRNRRQLRVLLKIDPVRIAWCAAFANAVLKKAGYDTTESLVARSFLIYGERTRRPQKGDIVVFSRGRRGGHVGFFMGYDETGKYVLVLGGNQRKQVNVVRYPRRRVLGYRRIT